MPNSRPSIRSMLTGGDRRSIGQADAVAALLTKNSKLAAELIDCLFDTDPVVCMRSADALEKASRTDPTLLHPYKKQLLGLLISATQIELRWHLAQMIPRLRLTSAERHYAAEILQTYLADRSSIVRTFAMQALADLALQDAALHPIVTERIHSLMRTGTPAMRARGRKLLAILSPGC